MKRRLALTWGACFALAFGTSAGVLFMVKSALLPEQHAALREVLSASAGVIVVAAFIVFLLTGVLAYVLTRAYFLPARGLTESLRLIAGGNPGHRPHAEGSRELRELAEAANLLATRHEEALRDVQTRVTEARADADQQRNRLGALMSELAQSVIVCNADGRILLYNERARSMFTDPTGETGAPSYVGLGRAVSTLLEPDLLTHALEQLRSRLARGEPRPVAVFMAALPAGALARVQMAPVATTDESSRGPQDALAGFVLLLEDIGEEVRRAERSDHLLQDLTESVRSALAGVRAAVENLLNYPEMESARRQQFTGIIREEADRLTGKLDRTMREYSEYVKSQRSLEQIRAADLIEVIRHRIEGRLGLMTGTDEVDPALWVTVDSYSMVQAVCYLASNLKEHVNVRAVRFAAIAAGRHASIDLTWIGATLAASTALNWENEPLTSGGETSPLTFREVLDRHRAEAWYRARPGAAPLLLPPAAADRGTGERRAGRQRTARSPRLLRLRSLPAAGAGAPALRRLPK